MRTIQPCGTYAGYQTHKRRHEESCAECKRANTEYSQQHRGCKPRAERYRLYPTDEELGLCNERRLARNRALRKLGREYPERLAELVAEEVSKVAG
jgi:hypothetical protein